MGKIKIDLPEESFFVEIAGDEPTPSEQIKISNLIRNIRRDAQQASAPQEKSELVQRVGQIDPYSGIKSTELRAALSAAETKDDQEAILKNIFGMTETDFFRDKRGQLGLTPEGAKKVGVEIDKSTIIDESGFSRYDFADMAGIAPEVTGAVVGGLKGAAAGTAVAGPLGAVIGGALGAGTGAVTGQAIEEIAESSLGVQTQTASEIADDLKSEFVTGVSIDLTLGLFGLGASAIGKSMKAGKGLTPDEMKIASESIEMGINPTLSAIRAPSVVARQQGIVEKIFGSSPRLKKNNDIMQQKIQDFRDRFGSATDEEVGQILMSGTGKKAAEDFAAEQRAQIAVLNTLRESADVLGAAAERNLNVSDDVFDAVIGARNEFESQMKILFKPIDDALESDFGTEKFIPLNQVKTYAEEAENFFRADLAAGRASELQGVIRAVKGLKDKESFTELYNTRKTINDSMSLVKTNGGHWNRMKTMRDAIDSMLTVRSLEDVFNELGTTSANRNILTKASARFDEARGKYKEGMEIFEDIEKAGVIKELSEKARRAREGNTRMDVSDIELKKIIKNKDKKTLERTLRAVAYGNSKDAKKVSSEQFRRMIAGQWLNDALSTSGLSAGRDFDPSKFKGAAFEKAVNDLGETASVLFGDEVQQIRGLAKRIGKTNISNLDSAFVNDIIRESGADAPLSVALKNLADAQDAIHREQKAKVLRDLQSGDMNQIEAAEVIASGTTSATDIEKIMNAFASEPEAIRKIQANYMERLISDFGETLTTDGKQLSAFAKRLLDADKGGKLQVIFGKEVGEDMAQFARILDFNARSAAGGDLVAANIAASPIHNIGKLARFTIVGKLLQSGPYYKQIVNDYKAISKGLDPREKQKTLGRLIADALTRAAAQATGQQTQAGIQEAENQIRSLAESSGINDQLSQLQQQVSVPNNSSTLVQPVPQTPPAPSGLRQQAAQNPGIAQALGIRGATAGLLGNP